MIRGVTMEVGGENGGSFILKDVRALVSQQPTLQLNSTLFLRVSRSSIEIQELQNGSIKASSKTSPSLGRGELDKNILHD